MLRAALATIAVAALVAGCGGKSKPESIQPPITTAPTGPDPGKQVIDAFVAAAGRGDAKALWALLSTATQARLGPFSHFRGVTAIELAGGVGLFARGTYKEIVSERVADRFGVVAIAGLRTAEGTREYAAYGTALRLEEGSWRVELGGPIQIQILGPGPGPAEQAVVQVGAEIHARAGGLATAVGWLDGATIPSQLRGTAKAATFFANLASPVAPGRHTAVVFAGGAKDASATAWTFSVR
jgi:hypothetical protein